MEKKSNLLIVAKDEGLRSFLAVFLGNNYQPIFKNCINEAWEWLQSGNIPDILIASISLHDENFIEFIEGLKQSSFFGTIPLIVLSSNSVDSRSEYPSNVVKILPKPFDPIELLNILESLNAISTNSLSFH